MDFPRAIVHEQPHPNDAAQERERRVIILGAAGRDFFDFLSFWRCQPNTRVVAFTATQIPGIENRTFPAQLAGPGYEHGIPIYPQEQVEALIRKHRVHICVLAYSDLRYEYVMSLGSAINAAGSAYVLLSPQQTWLPSSKPVISVCAVRTGAGKSQTTRWISSVLKKMGKKIVVVRHPMPYGDLLKMRVQRFATFDDLDKFKCTIEEREEYEQHLENKTVVYAGVDYEAILRECEKEADVILWDGGNNDAPFYKPDLHIVVADALRPGHEKSYYPGETNARLADVLLINKCGSAKKEQIELVEANLRRLSATAPIIKCESPLSGQLTFKEQKEKVHDAEGAVKGKRVLVIEDGPTLTHGGMAFGAGFCWATRQGASQVIDPRPFARGSLKAVFAKFTQLHNVLPAMGYSQEQIKELQETVAECEKHCDLVVFGTPINLNKVIHINKPAVRVRYELRPEAPQLLERILKCTLGEGEGCEKAGV